VATEAGDVELAKQQKAITPNPYGNG